MENSLNQRVRHLNNIKILLDFQISSIYRNECNLGLDKKYIL